MIFDPTSIFRDLTNCLPVRLDELPRENGIYALHDHTGIIRYIGITKSDKFGFYGRIHDRHVTGSEGRSHKFSHAYNTGRMWRDKKDASPDAVMAKALRTLFARRYCKATFVVVRSKFLGELARLEADVQAIATSGLLDWGNERSFLPLIEPKGLVNALLDDLCWLPEQRAAVSRQAVLHSTC